jgi:chemotaxis protein MotA
MILNWIAVIIGIGAIIGGAFLEGLHMSALSQPTAALIVFGGTFGATLLSATPSEFSQAIRWLSKVFLKNSTELKPLIQEIVDLATIARKEGILALDSRLANIKNPFFASNLRHIVDGYDPNVLKEMMEERIYHEETEKMGIAKVFETAGGYAPTIGIVGAVLGLIHVMGNLSDSSKLGEGIAVAFVATVYGVGSANLILIPMGNKMKKIAKEEIHQLEVIKTGLLCIQAGLNPRVIEDRLHNLLGEHSSPEEGQPDIKKAA